MSTPHPVVTRQTARAFLEALHAGHFPPAPGRPVYTLDDLLGHLVDGGRYGFGDERLAQALGIQQVVKG